MRNITTIIIVFLLYQTSLSLDPNKYITQYRYDSWSSREGLSGFQYEGLPYNSILNIKQDKEGYLWLSSEAGIFKFDGQIFNLYNFENTPEIWRQGVNKISVVDDSSVWFGSDKLLCYKNRQFKSYDLPDIHNINMLTCVYADSKGIVWFGLRHFGLCKLENNQISVVLKNGKSVYEILEDKNGAIWVGVANKSVIYKIESGKITEFVTPEDPIDIVFPGGMIFDKRGRLFVAFNSSIYTFNGKNFVKIKLDDTIGFITSIILDKDENLWIGCKNGLFRYTKGGLSQVDKNIIPGNVTNVFEDRDGNIWVSMNWFGIVRIKETTVRTFGIKEGLSSDNCSAIYKDYDGTVWIGTHNGLHHLNNGNIKIYTKKDGLQSDFITSIYRDKFKKLWIGCNIGLQYMRGEKFVPVAQDSIQKTRIDIIEEDSTGTLWLGSIRNKLFIYKNNIATDYFKLHKKHNDEVRIILNDSANGMWFGGQRGLYHFYNGKTKLYKTQDGLARNSVRSLHKSKDGSLWIGTMWGGLSRFKNNKFTNYSLRQGIHNDAITQLVEDTLGNLWFGSKGGIFSIPIKQFDDFDAGKIKKLNPLVLGYLDGARSGECSNVSHYRAWNKVYDQIWFPTPIGASRVEVDHVYNIPNVVPVYIENVSIDSKNITMQNDMVIPPSDGKIEIRYTGVCLSGAEKVKYKYMLEGFDKDWIYADKNKFATYTNIPPGKYTFTVMASNVRGDWINNKASFMFYLEPHFYETSWFYLLIFMLLAFGVYGIIQWRVRYLKLREAELKIKVDEAIAQIKVLSGLVPICANCKKVRDDQGFWTQVEAYVQERSDARFSHSVCPACAEKLYPEYYKKVQEDKENI